MVKVYGYKKWSTVAKSLKFLDQNNLEYEFFDFVANQIEKAELERLIKKSNLGIDAFLNSKGTLFKQLGLKDKIDDYSYEQKLDLLLSDGKIIKRPIIEFADKIYKANSPFVPILGQRLYRRPSCAARH